MVSDDLMRQAQTPFGKRGAASLLAELIHSSEAVNRGREAERAAIISWLRSPENIYGPHLYLAAAIDATEHLNEGTES